MKVLVFTVFAMTVVGVQAQVVTRGSMSQMLNGMAQNQGNQLMSIQGPHMMPNQASQMIPSQEPQMGEIHNQVYSYNNNMYSNNYRPQNGAYVNQQRPNQSKQSAMSLMPFFFSGERARTFAMMSLMGMNRMGMNGMAPWFLMDGGMEGGMWPLIAMTNNRRIKINPMMMMAAGGMM